MILDKEVDHKASKGTAIASEFLEMDSEGFDHQMSVINDVMLECPLKGDQGEDNSSSSTFGLPPLFSDVLKSFPTDENTFPFDDNNNYKNNNNKNKEERTTTKAVFDAPDASKKVPTPPPQHQPRQANGDESPLESAEPVNVLRIESDNEDGDDGDDEKVIHARQRAREVESHLLAELDLTLADSSDSTTERVVCELRQVLLKSSRPSGKKRKWALDKPQQKRLKPNKQESNPRPAIENNINRPLNKHTLNANDTRNKPRHHSPNKHSAHQTRGNPFDQHTPAAATGLLSTDYQAKQTMVVVPPSSATTVGQPTASSGHLALNDVTGQTQGIGQLSTLITPCLSVQNGTTRVVILPRVSQTATLPSGPRYAQHASTVRVQTHSTGASGKQQQQQQQQKQLQKHPQETRTKQQQKQQQQQLHQMHQQPNQQPQQSHQVLVQQQPQQHHQQQQPSKISHTSTTNQLPNNTNVVHPAFPQNGPHSNGVSYHKAQKVKRYNNRKKSAPYTTNVPPKPTAPINQPNGPHLGQVADSVALFQTAPYQGFTDVTKASSVPAIRVNGLQAHPDISQFRVQQHRHGTIPTPPQCYDGLQATPTIGTAPKVFQNPTLGPGKGQNFNTSIPSIGTAPRVFQNPTIGHGTGQNFVTFIPSTGTAPRVFQNPTIGHGTGQNFVTSIPSTGTASRVLQNPTITHGIGQNFDTAIPSTGTAPRVFQNPTIGHGTGQNFVTSIPSPGTVSKVFQNPTIAHGTGQNFDTSIPSTGTAPKVFQNPTIGHGTGQNFVTSIPSTGTVSRVLQSPTITHGIGQNFVTAIPSTGTAPKVFQNPTISHGTGQNFDTSIPSTGKASRVFQNPTIAHGTGQNFDTSIPPTGTASRVFQYPTTSHGTGQNFVTFTPPTGTAPRVFQYPTIGHGTCQSFDTSTPTSFQQPQLLQQQGSRQVPILAQQLFSADPYSPATAVGQVHHTKPKQNQQQRQHGLHPKMTQKQHGTTATDAASIGSGSKQQQQQQLCVKSTQSFPQSQQAVSGITLSTPPSRSLMKTSGIPSSHATNVAGRANIYNANFVGGSQAPNNATTKPMRILHADCGSDSNLNPPASTANFASAPPIDEEILLPNDFYEILNKL